MSTPHSARRHTRRRGWIGAMLLLAAHSANADFLGGPVDAANFFRNAMQSSEIASVLRMLAPDVLIYDAGRELRSREAYAAGPLRRDLAHLSGLYAETLSQESAERGDTAWVTTRTRYLGKTPDNKAQFVGTETLVLHRLAGGWQIVHVHRSASAEAP